MGLKIRDDYESLRARAERPHGSGLQSTTFVGLTAAISTYPTAAGAFYAVAPQAVSGDEVEGGAFTTTGDPSIKILAYNLGSSIPPIGSRVLVFSVPNRWVFYYG